MQGLIVIPTRFLPVQIRAARALLDWSRADLAAASGVPWRTLARLEGEKGTPEARTVDAARSALERAGIEFLPEPAPGVRLHRPSPS